ncbi:MFS transporter [Calorimonas adulescens]|uniref:MFS transporter n=1 Tax=Calorimonas adulescens TaxID=2606906 RepID=A0A5D8Q8J5_9THEO|nr:MFS transporter [Calorimonas adulescens]TZE81095.1 MFS transporter [Calorimonas adulescens]
MKNRSFDLLWCARTISLLGDALFEIGLTLFIYDRTGSTIAMGMNLIMFFLPSVMFGFFGGILADRYNRKLIMVLSDMARGIILLILPVFINNDRWSLASVYVITFILSTVSQFYGPASSSILPQIVGNDSLVLANSTLTTTIQVINIVGPSLAGVVVKLYGTTATIYADSFSFFIGALLTYLIRIEGKVGKAEEIKGIKSLYTDLAIGVKYVLGRKDLKLVLTLMFILNALLGPLNVILPVYARNALRMAVEGYSMMLSSYAVGSLMGAAAVNFVVNYLGFSMLIGVGIISIGAGLATTGVFENLYYAVFAMAVVGIGTGIINVLVTVLIQKTTPADFLGRVSGTLAVIGVATVPLSIAVASVLLNYIDADVYFVCSGLVAVLFSVWYFIHGRSCVSYEEKAQYRKTQKD